MNIDIQDGILRVSGCRDLEPDTAEALLTMVRSGLTECRVVEIDLSEIISLDCRGIGVLVSIRNSAWKHAIQLRLMHPPAKANRLFHASRSAQLFDIVQAENENLPQSAGEFGQSRSVAARACG